MGRRGMIWIALGIAAALLVAVAANTLGRYTGLTVARTSPDALSALLSPHYRITRPEGDGPFPAALLFSGCDGPRDNLDRWTAELTARGWVTIVVDSHTPRNFGDYQIWRLICAGQLLTGAERAGDVATAVSDARALPFVDPDRIALVGASHGGWAILEYLSFADHGETPPSLDAWPGGPPGTPLDGIAGAVLLYPYCGQLSRAARRGWRTPVPVLFLLVENDGIADEAACLRLARQEAARGLPVETETYSGVTHGFDQQEKAPLSTLRFDEAATTAAVSRAGAFLDRIRTD